MTNVTGTQLVSDADSLYGSTMEPGFKDVFLNSTDLTPRVNHTEAGPPLDSGFELGTAVTVAIAVGSAVIIIIIGE